MDIKQFIAATAHLPETTKLLIYDMGVGGLVDVNEIMQGEDTPAETITLTHIVG